MTSNFGKTAATSFLQALLPQTDTVYGNRQTSHGTRHTAHGTMTLGHTAQKSGKSSLLNVSGFLGSVLPLSPRFSHLYDARHARLRGKWSGCRRDTPGSVEMCSKNCMSGKGGDTMTRNMGSIPGVRFGGFSRFWAQGKTDLILGWDRVSRFSPKTSKSPPIGSRLSPTVLCYRVTIKGGDTIAQNRGATPSNVWGDFRRFWEKWGSPSSNKYIKILAARPLVKMFHKIIFERGLQHDEEK